MSTAELPPIPRVPAEGSPVPVESRLAALAEAVARLETRVAALELAPPDRFDPIRGSQAEGSLTSPALASPVPLMAHLGRVCLILGGATFIRALVDAGTIHRGWGVALGLAYAMTWILLADRSKQALGASFHALASILIAYPLLVESTTRFGILSPDLAAFLLLAVTGLHGAVAWRKDLQPIIWTATLASLASGFAMMAARHAIEPFVAVFLLLGISTLWLTYGRRWHGLRWPTALAANLGVLILTTLAAWPGGPPQIYAGLTPNRGLSFALALAVLYIGSFALRMLQRRRVVNAFEAIQTVLVLLVGFGGALRVALASGSGLGLLGAGVSLAGLGCYAAAIPFAEDQEETRANFNFFTFLALIFLLLGGPIVLPMQIFAPLSGTLGLGAMLVGLRLRRTVLILQSGIYLGAAVMASGLGAWSARAFLDPAGPASSFPLTSLLCLGALCATLALFLMRRPPDPITLRIRPVIQALGALAAAGFGALAIRACLGAFPTGPLDAGLLAVVRTGVLSALALGLAWFGRRIPILELRWLVYPLLIITALKFLFEDVAMGRPLTLFLGFMCYGATLMLAPRLLKSPAPPDGGSGPNASLPEVDS